VERSIAKLRAWTPAQIAALVFGIWWIGNGVAVFLAEPTGAALDSDSAVKTLGLSIAVNGWHGLFHLITGLAGVAVCWWPGRARAFALIVGTIYLAAACWSLFDNATVFGLIRVDELGSADHAVEAALLLAAWLASASPAHQEKPPRRQSVPGS
jgi:hypothetical protein